MPANLTPQYHKAEEAFKAATTGEEKIAALEHMISVLPKHKGTDHLQADLRRRLSKLRQAGEKEARSTKKGFDPFRVEKQGSGQVLLLGAPNAGKSALVGRFTRAAVTETAYPFATSLPVPGMMVYEDVQIQLVDLPSITEGRLPPGILGLVKSADAALLVADLASPEVLDELEALLEALAEGRVRLCRREQPPGEPEPLTKDLPVLVLANKVDVGGAPEALELLREWIGDRFRVLPVSASRGDGLEDVPGEVFRLLDRIRVYTKEPGKQPDLAAPFTLPRGGTVTDLARLIHREFAGHLRQARVWGSARFEGQAVAREYSLQDRDVVELQIEGM